MGPLADSKPWNPKYVPGVRRFLQRSWRLTVPEFPEHGPIHAHLQQDRPDDPELEKALHRTIHKVDGDIERMAFNAAIAAMMIFVNDATKAMDKLSRRQLLRFAQLLQPFAPHLAEELWEILGRPAPVSLAPWPVADERWLKDDTVEIPVQIQGKLRSRVVVPAGADAAALQAAAAADPRVAEQLAGRRIVKVVAVPGRMVNFVLGD